MKQLNATLNRIMRESPTLLDGEGNWFDIAQRHDLAGDPQAMAKFEKDVIEREDKRREMVKAAGGDLTGDAPAGGKSETVEKELSKKFGG